MTTPKQTTLYANLMAEVKVRIECIDAALSGRTGFPAPIVREFCYLQLRLLCELIALSCLVAHGDIKSLQSHQTGKTYAAGEILDRLERLRPHFYPLASHQKMMPEGSANKFEIEILNPQPLPKAELLSLYGATHRHLHRGSLKGLLSSATSIDMTINLPEIIGWAQKINDLLQMHTIPISEDHLIICMLRNKDDNHNVQVVIAKRPSVKAPP